VNQREQRLRAQQAEQTTDVREFACWVRDELDDFVGAAHRIVVEDDGRALTVRSESQW
jgi:hypothetical protein